MSNPNRFNEPARASRHSSEDAQKWQELEDGQRYDSWSESSASGQSAESAYGQAMRKRLQDDLEDMKASIFGGSKRKVVGIGSEKKIVESTSRANAQGRHAFYLANEIRKARQDLSGADVDSAAWKQTVGDREDRLQDILLEDKDSLTPQEVDFLIDFSGGKYDEVMDEALTDTIHDESTENTPSETGTAEVDEIAEAPHTIARAAEAMNDPNVDSEILEALQGALQNIENTLDGEVPAAEADVVEGESVKREDSTETTDSQEAREGESLEEYEARMGAEGNPDIVEPLENEAEEIEPLQNERNEDEVEPLENEVGNDEVEPLENEAEDVEPLENEPDEDGIEPLENEKSRWQLVREKFSDIVNWPGRQAGVALVKMRAMRKKENETDDQFEKRKQRNGNIAIGAIAVGATLLTAWKIHNGMSSGTEGSFNGIDGSFNADPNYFDPITGEVRDDQLSPPTEVFENGSPEETPELPGGPGDGGETPPTPTPEEGSGREVDAIIDSFSDNARTVERGEGGLQTLREMGVSSSDYERIWEQVGNRLQETDQGDQVYRMSDGRWGWNKPGELNQKTLEIIAEVIANNR